MRQTTIPAFLSAESAITMLFAHEVAEGGECLRLFLNTNG